MVVVVEGGSFYIVDQRETKTERREVEVVGFTRTFIIQSRVS